MAQTNASPQNPGQTTLVLRLYFALLIIGGILSIGAVLQFPAEANNAVLFGLSKMRLLMILVVMIIIFGAVSILLSSWVRKSFFMVFEEAVLASIQKTTCWGPSILFSSLLLLVNLYLLLLIPEITEPFAQTIYIRLQPLIAWIAAISAQTLIALPLLRYGSALRELKPKGRVAYLTIFIFTSFLLLWFFMAQTRLGLTPTDAGAGWNALGTPVLETQVLFAWIIAVFYITLALWGEKREFFSAFSKKYPRFQIDLLISILLWTSAFIIWMSIPLIPNWFAAPPRPPNHVMYPNSDAYLYDTTGQTLLTGEGFKTQNGPFAIRPFYGLFLAGMHAFGGPDYETTVWMQVAVLALIPVLLYWITLKIHNRISALFAAVLWILRESNAIILSSSITTSHSKLLMADLPTTLGVMLLVLLLIHWLQQPVQRLRITLLAGGLTGAFILIRPEFGVLLPFLGIAALLELSFFSGEDRLHTITGIGTRSVISSKPEVPSTPLLKRIKLWFTGMLLIGVGTVLFLLPWIGRNYQLTGTIFLDSPHYRSDLFAIRYQEYQTDGDGITEDVKPESTKDPIDKPEEPAQTPSILETTATPTPKVAYKPGEDADDFSERMFSKALDYAKNNLGAVSYFITNHFLNSQLQTVLYLPATFRLTDSAVSFLGHRDPVKLWEQCCSAKGYIRRLPFWFKWDGNLPRQSILPLTVNLAMISLGLSFSWKRLKVIALLPLFASLGYTLVNALVRNYGGRYILPVNWISILYFSIGFCQVTLWIVEYFRKSHLSTSVLGNRPLEYGARPETRTIWEKNTLSLAVLILLSGLLLPFSEKLVPQRYPPELLIERQDQLGGLLDFLPEEFISQGGSIVGGIALYPRFHNAGEGEVGDRLTPFSPKPFARLDFYLVGPFNGGIVLPQKDIPTDFPNGADVVAIGCAGPEYFDALAVVIYDRSGDHAEIFRRQPASEIHGCPLAQP